MVDILVRLYLIYHYRINSLIIGLFLPQIEFNLVILCPNSELSLDQLSIKQLEL